MSGRILAVEGAKIWGFQSLIRYACALMQVTVRSYQLGRMLFVCFVFGLGGFCFFCLQDWLSSFDFPQSHGAYP